MKINTNFTSALNAREDESKFLLTMDTIPRLDERIYQYFSGLGCEGYANAPRVIVTRQFDTPDYYLQAHGLSLRVRGNLQPSGIVTDADICIKVKQVEGSTSTLRLRRGEYEAKITSFDELDFNALRRKYPPSTNPEFVPILHMVERANVREQFRMNTTRPRFVLGIPNGFIDLQPEKRAFVELQADEVKFGLEDTYTTSKGGLVVFASDTEVEYEINSKVCPYDDYTNSWLYVSRGLTEYDREKVFQFMNDHLENHLFPKGTLEKSTVSKAERGFDYLDRLHDEVLVRHAYLGHLNRTALRSGEIALPKLLVTKQERPDDNDRIVVLG